MRRSDAKPFWSSPGPLADSSVDASAKPHWSPRRGEGLKPLGHYAYGLVCCFHTQTHRGGGFSLPVRLPARQSLPPGGVRPLGIALAGLPKLGRPAPRPRQGPALSKVVPDGGEGAQLPGLLGTRVARAQVPFNGFLTGFRIRAPQNSPLVRPASDARLTRRWPYLWAPSMDGRCYLPTGTAVAGAAIAWPAPDAPHSRPIGCTRAGAGNNKERALALRADDPPDLPSYRLAPAPDVVLWRRRRVVVPERRGPRSGTAARCPRCEKRCSTSRASDQPDARASATRSGHRNTPEG